MKKLVFCLVCNKELWRSPSKVEPRNFCSRECYSSTRIKELKERGVPYHYKRGHKPSKNNIESLKKLSGEKHYAWKGKKVSYRGLHYWIRRKLGKPMKCIKCGKYDEKPRSIQWANIDGKYRRELTDYIPLCVSCHKLHDINLKQST